MGIIRRWYLRLLDRVFPPLVAPRCEQCGAPLDCHHDLVSLAGPRWLQPCLSCRSGGATIIHPDASLED
jgi:hypothetical protein